VLDTVHFIQTSPSGLCCSSGVATIPYQICCPLLLEQGRPYRLRKTRIVKLNAEILPRLLSVGSCLPSGANFGLAGVDPEVRRRFTLLLVVRNDPGFNVDGQRSNRRFGAAPGTDARRAETASAGSVHDSPVSGRRSGRRPVVDQSLSEDGCPRTNPCSRAMASKAWFTGPSSGPDIRYHSKSNCRQVTGTTLD